MTVGDLRKLTNGLPDEMDVLIPMNAGEGFDGCWLRPCLEESGVSELGFEDIDEEEAKERELLNNPPKTEKTFCLVPCGFFQEHEGPAPQMN